jgi:tetrahydromethanopterin S-methyltransferase subunit G
MEAMRKSWTDERLDDLARRVDDGFDRVDARFAQVDARFDKLDARFDGLQRTMIQTSGLIIAALIGLIATQL